MIIARLLACTLLSLVPMLDAQTTEAQIAVHRKVLLAILESEHSVLPSCVFENLTIDLCTPAGRASRHIPSLHMGERQVCRRFRDVCVRVDLLESPPALTIDKIEITGLHQDDIRRCLGDFVVCLICDPEFPGIDGKTVLKPHHYLTLPPFNLLSTRQYLSFHTKDIRISQANEAVNIRIKGSLWGMTRQCKTQEIQVMEYTGQEFCIRLAVDQKSGDVRIDKIVLINLGKSVGRQEDWLAFLNRRFIGKKIFDAGKLSLAHYLKIPDIHPRLHVSADGNYIILSGGPPLLNFQTITTTTQLPGVIIFLGDSFLQKTFWQFQSGHHALYFLPILCPVEATIGARAVHFSLKKTAISPEFACVAYHSVQERKKLHDFLSSPGVRIECKKPNMIVMKGDILLLFDHKPLAKIRDIEVCYRMHYVHSMKGFRLTPLSDKRKNPAIRFYNIEDSWKGDRLRRIYYAILDLIDWSLEESTLRLPDIIYEVGISINGRKRAWTMQRADSFVVETRKGNGLILYADFAIKKGEDL